MGDREDRDKEHRDHQEPSIRDILNDLARGQRELQQNIAQMCNMMAQHLLGNNNNNTNNNGGNNGRDDGLVNNKTVNQHAMDGIANSRSPMSNFPPRNQLQVENEPTQ